MAFWYSSNEKKIKELEKLFFAGKTAITIYPTNIFEWMKKVRPIVEGKKRDVDLFRALYPMWEEIYTNPAHKIKVMGGRQIFKTTWIADRLCFLCTTKPGSTVTYVTDNEVHLSEFSNQKFRRGCIEQNHLLKSAIRGGKIGKISEVSWTNNSVTYLVTDEGEYIKVESTSPIEVIHDEDQYQDLQFLPILREAMATTQGKQKLAGIGGEAGSPLDFEWQKCDQREWVYEDLNWRDKIKRDVEGNIINEIKELKEITRGRWVATKPENYMYPGYHLPQEIFAHIPMTILDAIEKHHTDPEYSIEFKKKTYPPSIYTTHVEGKLYRAMRRPITIEMIKNCMIPYLSLLKLWEIAELKQTFGTQIRILGGVDFGSGPAASATVGSILIKWKKSQRYQLAWIEKRPQENLDDQAEYLTNCFMAAQIDIGVGDLGYGAQQVKKMQQGGANRLTGKLYPGLGEGRFIGCRTIGDETKPLQEYKLDVDEHGEEVGHLKIDKTNTIQKFVDFLEWYVPHPRWPENEKFRRTKLMIPSATAYETDWLIPEWTQLTRKDLKEIEDVSVPDPRQFAKKEYNHPKDSLMSVIYCMVADEQEEGGYDIH